MNIFNIAKAKRLHKKRVQRELKRRSQTHKIIRMEQFYKVNFVCNPKLMYAIEVKEIETP